VTRFASFEDREGALRMGFTAVLAEGTEKFDSLAKKLAAA
jgi:hypothetical protein